MTLVMDGRDIGTLRCSWRPGENLPDSGGRDKSAQEIRGTEEKGIQGDLEQIQSDIEQRDYRICTGDFTRLCRRKMLFIWIPPI